MSRFTYITSIAASFIVCLLGVYLWLTAESHLPNIKVLLETPSMEPHMPEPLMANADAFDWVYTWDAPVLTSTQGFTYDVFTPQSLWRDEVTKQLVASVPQSVVNAEDWGARLLSLDRQWYRLQFEGYTEGGPLVQGKAKLYFGDLVHGKRVVGYVGSRIPKMGVRVLAFEPNAWERRSSKPGTTPSRNPEVVILDELTGEEIVLKQKDPQYTSRWVARVGVPGEGEVFFNEVGESRILGNTRLSVNAVNFETGSLTLQREDLNTGKVEYAVLSQ